MFNLIKETLIKVNLQNFYKENSLNKRIILIIFQ